MNISVRLDDLSSAEVQALVSEHMAGMMSNTPAESVHALPLDKLRQPNITFWTAWSDSELCGCGALHVLDPKHGEVKSMRTRTKFLRQGVAQAVLNEIIQTAKAKGLHRLSLETGSTEVFAPAVKMYQRNRFEICGPFGSYQLDPHSVFMTRTL